MAPPTEHGGSATASDATADRWGLLWSGFFALTLILPTVMSMASAATVMEAAITAGTAAGFALWHWWMGLRQQRWEGHPRMLVWFAGALVFTAVLIGRDERFGIMVYGLYPQVFSLLGRFGIPAAIMLTLLVFWQNGALTSDDVPVAEIAGSVGLAIMLGLFVTALVRQNTARKEALDKLEATRAELAATARRAGVLEERQRMARDLHDTVAQGFTGIVMQLEASEEALAADPARAREHLRRASESARNGLDELRRVAHALRPEPLDHSSLTEAVAATAEQWEQDTGIAVTTRTQGTPSRLHPDTEVALLRTLQEALANIAKHARATKVEVQLSFDSAGAALTVTDDGVGFDQTHHGGEGAGLRGITERLTAIGGALTVDTGAGSGTTLAARVPAS